MFLERFDFGPNSCKDVTKETGCIEMAGEREHELLTSTGDATFKEAIESITKGKDETS